MSSCLRAAVLGGAGAGPAQARLRARVAPLVRIERTTVRHAVLVGHVGEWVAVVRVPLVLALGQIVATEPRAEVQARERHGASDVLKTAGLQPGLVVIARILQYLNKGLLEVHDELRLCIRPGHATERHAAGLGRVVVAETPILAGQRGQLQRPHVPGRHVWFAMAVQLLGNVRPALSATRSAK